MTLYIQWERKQTHSPEAEVMTVSAGSHFTGRFAGGAALNRGGCLLCGLGVNADQGVSQTLEVFLGFSVGREVC